MTKLIYGKSKESIFNENEYIVIGNCEHTFLDGNITNNLCTKRFYTFNNPYRKVLRWGMYPSNVNYKQTFVFCNEYFRLKFNEFKETSKGFPNEEINYYTNKNFHEDCFNHFLRYFIDNENILPFKLQRRYVAKNLYLYINRDGLSDLTNSFVDFIFIEKPFIVAEIPIKDALQILTEHDCQIMLYSLKYKLSKIAEYFLKYTKYKKYQLFMNNFIKINKYDKIDTSKIIDFMIILQELNLYKYKI